MQITRLESVTILEIGGHGYFGMVSFLTSHADDSKYRILNVAVMIDNAEYERIKDELSEHIRKSVSRNYISQG